VETASAFPHLTPRQDNRKDEEGDATLNLVLKHSDATIAAYI
jgi:hypothetical protein